MLDISEFGTTQRKALALGMWLDTWGPFPETTHLYSWEVWEGASPTMGLPVQHVLNVWKQHSVARSLDKLVPGNRCGPKVMAIRNRTLGHL